MPRLLHEELTGVVRQSAFESNWDSRGPARELRRPEASSQALRLRFQRFGAFGVFGGCSFSPCSCVDLSSRRLRCHDGAPPWTFGCG